MTSPIAEPIVVAPLTRPTAAPPQPGALAAVPAGRAHSADEACRAADGSVSGVSDAPRACTASALHRSRVARAVEEAMLAGFAGVCLERPDAALAVGLLGAGFCESCEALFARELAREYGEHFQPVRFLQLAREAIAQSPGAVTAAELPFGRDFMRMRQASFLSALAAHARFARDLARARGRSFTVAARMEALGPAQLQGARGLDAAIFPAPLGPTDHGAGLLRLLRAAMGPKPATAVPPASWRGAALDRFAAVAAACGVEVQAPEEARGDGLEHVRRFARQMASRRHAAALAKPVAECALLYSAEADLWSGGAHREALARAGEALATLHAQAPVYLKLEDVPPAATLVLAGASALSPLEAKEVRRRTEAGAGVLVLGELGQVDEGGRPLARPLPPGKPAGAKVGEGLLAELALPPAGADARGLEPLGRALSALLGKGRRACSIVGKGRVAAFLYDEGENLDVHLVNLGAEPAQGALYLGLHVAGDARKGRLYTAEGGEEKVKLEGAGYSATLALPPFATYAVLALSR